MKKVLLFSVLFFSMLSVLAYETIIINYPDGEKWEKAYYKKINGEAILQLVPLGQTKENWSRSIIVHSYRDSGYAVNIFISNSARKMLKANPTGKYKPLKMSENDAILTRCTDNYNDIKAQCEFFRATRAHDGIITLHYINRDKKDFMNNYTMWLEIIAGAKYYNSYYRGERTFNKSEYFELW